MKHFRGGSRIFQSMFICSGGAKPKGGRQHVIRSNLAGNCIHVSGGSRIFPGGAPTPKIAIIFHIFAENCMKMKEFGPPGGGARVPGAPLGSANACEKYWTDVGGRAVCVQNLPCRYVTAFP